MRGFADIITIVATLLQFTVTHSTSVVALTSFQHQCYQSGRCIGNIRHFGTQLSVLPNRKVTAITDNDNFPTNDKNGRRNSMNRMENRRTLLQRAVIGAITTTTTSTTTTTTTTANAFPNKISNQYDDRPKRRGPKPTDLGVGVRKDDMGDEYIGLKSCKMSPNCFSSTINILDDPDHSIPAWVYPMNITQKEAMEQLYTVLQKYIPGQGNIDGGGFSIVQYDPNQGYMYVQFESLKNGYIDDFEAAVIPPPDDTDIRFPNNKDDSKKKKNSIQIRSSSRIGYLDYGVNSIRLNYIAQQLRNAPYFWDAVGVDPKTHSNYFIENGLL